MKNFILKVDVNIKQLVFSLKILCDTVLMTVEL
jgi:hypothetical protein